MSAEFILKQSEPVKLISDEDRNQMKQNKGEFLELMAEYKKVEKQLNDLSAKQKELSDIQDKLKVKLCPMLRERGEQNKTGKTFKYKKFGYDANVTQRRNIEFIDKNAFINYCKQSDIPELLELIETKEDIDRKRFNIKWDQGSLSYDDISCFININYTDVLSIKGEENLNLG